MISELFNPALTPEIRVQLRGRFIKKWPSKEEIRAFYRSEEWEKARYKQLAPQAGVRPAARPLKMEPT